MFVQTKYEKEKKIQEIKLIAISNGGKCLSKKYINNRTKLKFKCSEGHIWFTKPLVIKNGSWCLECSGKKKYSIKTVNKIASERGGVCLSKNYSNNSSKLKFKCSEGHIFYSTFKSIKNLNTWCPNCYIYHREEICRIVLEKLFLKKFPKSSPIWLKENKELRSYELDGYSEELGIAFEHQGEHHFKEVGYNYKKTLNEIKRRDKLKAQICKKNNVKLIYFTYKDDLIYIKDLVKKRCNELNISTNKINFNKSINFNSIYTNKNKIKELQNIAKLRGGKLLSKLYINAHTTLEWQCKMKHKWMAKPYAVKNNNTWCKKCSYVKISKSAASKNILILREIARKKGGNLISNKFINWNSNLKWSCRFNHIWEASPHSIKNKNSWCKKCYHNNRKIN